MEATAPVVTDTGFIVALMNQTDSFHGAVTEVYATLKQPALLPQTVLAEVAYLVGRAVGIPSLVAFLRGLSSSRFKLVALNEQDVERTAAILETYEDSRIDFVDASVMALAERFGSRTVLTLDHRDFRLFRPRHCDYFELLPVSAQ